jgi:cytochrome c oxidase subunit 4
MAGRVVQPPVYYAVFAALIALTVLTVAISFIDLGAWHTVVGLVIGAAKATLVILFFMHLLYSGRLLWIVLGAGLFWLGIMLALTLADYFTRHPVAY